MKDTPVMQGQLDGVQFNINGLIFLDLHGDLLTA